MAGLGYNHISAIMEPLVTKTSTLQPSRKGFIHILQKKNIPSIGQTIGSQRRRDKRMIDF